MLGLIVAYLNIIEEGMYWLAWFGNAVCLGLHTEFQHIFKVWMAMIWIIHTSNQNTHNK